MDIDRDAAGRLGVTVATIDNALYDAFGQRLISTIFTQSSQYRVVLEAGAEFQAGPAALDGLYVRPTRHGPAGRCRCPRWRMWSSGRRRWLVNHVGAVPVGHRVVQPRARRSRWASGGCHQGRGGQAGTAARVETSFQGAALAFQSSLTSTLLLILAAVVTMYIVLGVLYESYIHPVTILSTLPSAGVGALLSLLLVARRNWT